MTKTIITTIGTSIFENYRQTYLNENESIDDAIDALKNIKAKDLDLKNFSVKQIIGDEEDYGIERNFFRGKVIKEKKYWKKISDNNILNTHASAEISSILKIFEKNQNTKLKVYLLATDTVLSVLAAKLIKEWFNEAKKVEDKYSNIEIIFNDNVKSPNSDYIENLRTDLNEEELFEGFDNLIKKVIEISKNKKENTIINITGGYKGFIPILTIIAQLEGLKLNYIYEDSDELIEIGQFPVNFDFFVAETYHYYLENIKRIKSIDDKERKILIDLHLVTEQNKLTSFGAFFLNYLNNVDFSRDTLGHYYEHKLFYHLFKKEAQDDIVKDLQGYEVKEIGKKINNGEIDLILSNTNNEKVFIEVKSFGKIGKSISQFEKYIKHAKENEIALKKIILFIYKMDFQNLKDHINSFRKIKENSDGIEFLIYYSEILISQSEKINYKALFENDLQVKKYNY